jgi:hypothetical protein
VKRSPVEAAAVPRSAGEIDPRQTFRACHADTGGGRDQLRLSRADVGTTLEEFRGKKGGYLAGHLDGGKIAALPVRVIPKVGGFEPYQNAERAFEDAFTLDDCGQGCASAFQFVVGLLQGQFVDLAPCTADFLKAQGLFARGDGSARDHELALGGAQIEVGRDDVRRDTESDRVAGKAALVQQRLGGLAFARHTAPEVDLIFEETGDGKEVSRAGIDFGGKPDGCAGDPFTGCTGLRLQEGSRSARA